MALLMMGMQATTYQLDDFILKTVRVDDDKDITQENVHAMRNEASVYLILGKHCRIAECLYIAPIKNLVILKYYAHGNLREHIASSLGITLAELRKWARQMIKSVVELHQNGVRHSDIRLDQWLLDSEWNTRLSDFNASGFDLNERLGLQGSKALSIENPSHFMPRNPMDNNTMQSDIFALGSALYEREAGSVPFMNKDEEAILACFKVGQSPEVEDLYSGSIIVGCWRGNFKTARDLLAVIGRDCGLED
ncbi:kinase-like domain-containing protein [Delphinella strobiligena]|nr:kinase-like domain-containing protein [Delphinella strobiligena]